VVYLVDDDASVRRAAARLVRSTGLEARAFASGEELLAEVGPDSRGCLVADVKMPGMGGLELLVELRARGVCLPAIVVTAFDTDQTRAQARQAGAVEYFRKPVDGHALLDAIRWALDRDTDGAAPQPRGPESGDCP